jgi:hypothetical protein
MRFLLLWLTAIYTGEILLASENGKRLAISPSLNSALLKQGWSKLDSKPLVLTSADGRSTLNSISQYQKQDLRLMLIDASTFTTGGFYIHPSNAKRNWQVNSGIAVVNLRMEIEDLLNTIKHEETHHWLNDLSFVREHFVGGISLNASIFLGEIFAHARAGTRRIAARLTLDDLVKELRKKDITNLEHNLNAVFSGKSLQTAAVGLSIVSSLKRYPLIDNSYAAAIEAANFLATRHRLDCSRSLIEVGLRILKKDFTPYEKALIHGRTN